MQIGRIAGSLSHKDMVISSQALEVSKEGSETRRSVAISTHNTPLASDSPAGLMI